MLINVSQPEECRIAIVEDGVLEELYIERASQDNYVGNIYKGKVVNLEPSIQAAFVDFGVGRNGFLHISDVEPQYFRQGGFDPEPVWGPAGRVATAAAPAAIAATTRARRSRSRRSPRRPPAGQTAHPGHLPPRRRSPRAGHQRRHRHQGADACPPTSASRTLPRADAGVGARRRFAQNRRRRRAPQAPRYAARLNPPKGLGFIVRTAGRRTKKELSRDLAYLLRLWKVIVRRIKKRQRRVDIYEESDMIIRTIRDIFTTMSTRSTSTNRRPTNEPKSSCSWSCPATSIACTSTKARNRCSTSTAGRRNRQDPQREVPLREGAARSSSTRPRPWSPSTSTAATFRADDSPKKRPTK
jgi:ribonuclease E